MLVLVLAASPAKLLRQDREKSQRTETSVVQYKCVAALGELPCRYAQETMARPFLGVVALLPLSESR